MKNESDITTMTITNITSKITDLMIGDNANFPARIREQEKRLKEEKCENIEFGKLIEEFEMPILIEILNSTDAYFHESFPELNTFNRLKRQEFAREIQKHGETCPRCKIKIAQDWEWENEFEASVSAHPTILKNSFGEQKRFFKK